VTAAEPSNSTSVVRTRFAPSPSGHLHVGGARTALFCWAYARKRGGKFIVRIEDTDQKRSSDAAGMAFLEDLKWLGIEWDEGPEHDGCGGGAAAPYLQSQRLDLYNQQIDRLMTIGRAYRAFETPAELDAARDLARREGRKYRYDRASLRLDAATVSEWLAEGRPHVVRFKIPDEGVVVVRDQVRGEVVTDVRELDDFVIRKADGYPMYNFAVVVDDELMGVTHVIRAEEHLSNTPKHILLQEAFGFRTPVYAHVSIITNPDGSKMSKRDKDKALRRAVKERGLDGPPGATVSPDRWVWWLESSDRQLEFDEAERLAEALGIHLPEINVDDFRRNGYLPDALLNYLALLGWNPGDNVEKFDRAFFVDRFDFDRVIPSPAKFDREKLLSFNLDAVKALDPSAFERLLREHGERYHAAFVQSLGANFSLFAACNQARSKTLDDPFRTCRFFVTPDEDIEYDTSKNAVKAMSRGLSHLEHMPSVLAEVRGSWDPDHLKRAIEAYATANADGRLGDVAQPLRIAASGTTVSPAIFETLAILGPQSTQARIRRAVEFYRSLPAQ